VPVSDQGVNLERYMLIPRTAIFVRRGGSYLLLKGAPSKRLWAGKFNGLGGHVEQGEDVLTAAKRELMEETGLEVELWLCGTVVVDTGQNPGICLYVFSGECEQGEPKPSKEGAAEWVPFEALGKLPAVEDLPVLLGRIHRMKHGDVPFAARSFYDNGGKLVVRFSRE
jgi:8-oxo-dGTP diphosphatase